METRNYSAFRLSYRSGGSYGKTENIAKTRCFRTDTRIIPHNKLLGNKNGFIVGGEFEP